MATIFNPIAGLNTNVPVVSSRRRRPSTRDRRAQGKRRSNPSRGFPNVLGNSNRGVTKVNTLVPGHTAPMSTSDMFENIRLSRKTQRELPMLEITSVNMSFISHEELKKISVVTVIDPSSRGIRTVNDPRMGVVERDMVCSTCNQSNLQCPGHPGMILLESMVYRPQTKSLILKTLASVCNSCGGLLLSEDELKDKGLLKLKGHLRLKAIGNASLKTQCRDTHNGVSGRPIRCAMNPVFKSKEFKNTNKVMYKLKNLPLRELPIQRIKEIFDGISIKDAKLLGFENESHPSMFILQSLPVIPPCARPSLVQNGNIWDNDLTVMYREIIKLNNALGRAKAEKNDAKEQATYTDLVNSINLLIDTPDGTWTQGNKQFGGIKQLINGKDGVIRASILGKRGDYAARSVLSPGPNLKYGQIGIPRVWAKIITRAIKIVHNNIRALTNLLRSGMITHIIPGSGKDEGRRISVNDRRKAEHTLHVGDTVERWLRNGDYVLFNRQPTLQKQGMMGYEVRLVEGNTIRLHMSATPAHNADFDGDEGNIYSPQSINVLQDVTGIMNVQNCIMNAQSNKPTVGLVMDNVSAAYLLTKDQHVTVEPTVFSMAIMRMTNQEDLSTLDARLEYYGIPFYSGRGLFSALLPSNFYYRKGDVIIQNGILLSGTITKQHIGTAHGSIIQVLHKDYGRDRTVDFLTDAPFVLNQWIMEHGFSVGLQDCFLKDETGKDLVNAEILKMKLRISAVGGVLEDKLEEERREALITGFVNIAKDVGSKIAIGKLAKDNQIHVMAQSGAKGDEYNLAQIMAMLGQQFIGGKRVALEIAGDRSLPYFNVNDQSPESRGFCTHAFIEGLTPAEQFFHQSAGRLGLLDTATKTQDTGDIYRRTQKSLEDIKIYNDGSVRNAIGYIFQLSYGDDGFDAAHLEKVSTSTDDIASFVNISRLVGKLNTKYGFLNLD